MTVSPDTKRWAFAFTKDDHKKYIGRWNNQKYDCKCQAGDKSQKNIVI